MGDDALSYKWRWDAGSEEGRTRKAVDRVDDLMRMFRSLQSPDAARYIPKPSISAPRSEVDRSTQPSGIGMATIQSRSLLEGLSMGLVGE